ncbi:hypothetical protein R5R35_013335 [Gryllus longicercus]|uniref:Uncharacterized protein n=1 Tax=Gryllus longicercus TaxID=2509291 RepID=A0AAN9V5I4_9ORTH
MEPENRIFSIKVFVTLVVLIALVTVNTMMSIASSKIEKIDTKLMRRVQHDKILFVMESERLIISIHNRLVRLPFVPHWIVYLFKSAVLFSPEFRIHSCKATWNNLTKILIAKLPSGREYRLPIELSDKIMKIVADNQPENSSPDIVTADMLENELSDLEKSIKDRLFSLQNDLRSFITEQNFLLKDLIQELNNTSQYSQTGDKYMKEFIPEQLNVWQKQMRVYNSALSENINNSHANLQSGFGRLEKTLGEMMLQLDALKISSEQNTQTHFEQSKEENEV